MGVWKLHFGVLDNLLCNELINCMWDVYIDESLLCNNGSSKHMGEYQDMNALHEWQLGIDM
jgi:hypothetical protein